MPHLLDVVSLLLLAELLLDRLELLPQEHLPLTLAELGLDLRLDVLLGVDARELPFDRRPATERMRASSSRSLEKPLLVFAVSKLQVERDEIRRTAPGSSTPWMSWFNASAGTPRRVPSSAARSLQLAVERLEGGVLAVSGRLLTIELQETMAWSMAWPSSS